MHSSLGLNSAQATAHERNSCTAHLLLGIYFRCHRLFCSVTLMFSQADWRMWLLARGIAFGALLIKCAGPFELYRRILHIRAGVPGNRTACVSAVHALTTSSRVAFGRLLCRLDAVFEGRRRRLKPNCIWDPTSPKAAATQCTAWEAAWPSGGTNDRPHELGRTFAIHWRTPSLWVRGYLVRFGLAAKGPAAWRCGCSGTDFARARGPARRPFTRLSGRLANSRSAKLLGNAMWRAYV